MATEKNRKSSTRGCNRSNMLTIPFSLTSSLQAHVGPTYHEKPSCAREVVNFKSWKRLTWPRRRVALVKSRKARLHESAQADSRPWSWTYDQWARCTSDRDEGRDGPDKIERSRTWSQRVLNSIVRSPAWSQRVFQLNRNEFCKRVCSIAKMIANKDVDRDESRERASSHATRVAMNYHMFDRDKARDEQVNLCTRERMKSNARRLALTDRIGLDGCSRERTNPWQWGLPMNKKRESTINYRKNRIISPYKCQKIHIRRNLCSGRS